MIIYRTIQALEALIPLFMRFPNRNNNQQKITLYSNSLMRV